MTHSIHRGVMAILLALALAVDPSAATAQGSDFTFRTVKPPKSGSKNRINIQVERTWPYDDPKDQAPPATDPETETAAAPQQPQTMGWFWDIIGGDLDGADPNRLQLALTTINKNAGGRARLTPDTGVLDDILARHGTDIMIATAGTRVSAALVLALISVESAGKPAALSPKGAQGLMQLMPATAKRFGVDDATDPGQNIRGGTKYLDWLLARFKGDPILALAGYNAGENAITKHNGVPPFAETRAYVPKVIAAWDKARLYCQTLPRYADDGCVFALDRSLSR